MRVFKYPVIPLSSREIYVTAPEYARPLSIEVQNGEPVMYMAVEENQLEVSHRILCVGTGHEFPVPPVLKFIGTAVLAEGRLVLHYFYCGHA